MHRRRGTSKGFVRPQKICIFGTNTVFCKKKKFNFLSVRKRSVAGHFQHSDASQRPRTRSSQYVRVIFHDRNPILRTQTSRFGTVVRRNDVVPDEPTGSRSPEHSEATSLPPTSVYRVARGHPTSTSYVQKLNIKLRERGRIGKIQPRYSYNERVGASGSCRRISQLKSS